MKKQNTIHILYSCSCIEKKKKNNRVTKYMRKN